MMCVPRVLAASVALVACVVTGATSSPARAAGGSTAVIVIDTGASVRSAVIHFDGTINGIQALELAGANPVTYGFAGQGAAVCALDGVGNPAGPSCLIGPNSEYWAYYLAHGGSGAWSYSRGCACTVTVHDGDVEGWRYGLGAAPRGSAEFCVYVACPAPPTVPPPTPPGGGGGSPGGGGAAVPPAEGGGGVASGGTASTGGGAPGADGGAAAGSTDPAAPNGATPTSTSTPTTTRVPGDRRGDREEAQVKGITASRGGPGDDDDSGSPVGVAVAAGVLAATAVGAVAIRRRRMRAVSGS
jgi:hypothetical protein